jgi:hypothetical protein
VGGDGAPSLRDTEVPRRSNAARNAIVVDRLETLG